MRANFLSSKRGNPCQICGDEKGKCRKVESVYLCMNFVDAGLASIVPGLKFIGQTKDGLWGKYVEDNRQDWTEQQRGQWQLEQRIKQQQRKAEEAERRAEALPAGERDRLYRHLLDQLTLHPSDRDDLERRGLTNEQIAAGRFKSAEQWQRLKSEISYQLPGVNLDGLSLNTQPGYLCPIIDVDGLVVGCQVRLRDASDGGRYRWFTSATKKRPNGATSHLPNGELPIAVHRPKQVNLTAIGMTEGTGVKPLIAAQRLDQIVIGAAGGQFTASQQTLKATLEKLAAETRSNVIHFYVDAGDSLNPSVIVRNRRTWKQLQDWGYTVLIGWWGQVDKTSCDIDELEDLGKIAYITPDEFLQSSDPAAYVKYLDEDKEQERIEAAQEEYYQENWFKGFCSQARQKLTAKALTRKAKTDTVAPICSNKTTQSSVPDAKDYEGKETPLVQYKKGERRKTWLTAEAKGWKVILDRSQPGLGKSHDAGRFANENWEDENWEDVNEEGNSAKVWYLSPNHTNPSTATIEANMVNMEPRHNGMVLEPDRKTPLGTSYRRHPKPEETEVERTLSNCKYADKFATLSSKGYAVNEERVLVEVEKDKTRSMNPVCAECSDNYHCHKEPGDGYGYKFERGETMAASRIRAHLDSAPTPGSCQENGEHNYKDDIAIVDEAGQSIRATKTVETDLAQLAVEWAYVETNDPETFDKLQEVRRSLNQVVQGEANDAQNRANHQAIASILPKAPSCLEELIAKVKKALPSAADLKGERDSVQGMGGKLRKKGNFIRSKMRQEARTVCAKKIQDLPTAALVNILNVWSGNGRGALRCDRGKLFVTVPDDRHAGILNACGLVIILDATTDKAQHAKNLGIDPNEILEIEEECSPLFNLKVVNINVSGLGSSQVSDSAKQRVMALLPHITEKHGKQPPVIAFKKDKEWLQDWQKGYWFVDSRGSNQFIGEEVIVSINSPRTNLGAAQDKYLCLYGNLDGFEEHYQRSIEQEQIQCVGRQRAHLEPDKLFVHYVIGTDQNLDFLKQEYGCEVVDIEAIKVCPEAGTKGQQFELLLVEVAAQFLETGKKITQVSLAATSGVSQQFISKTAKRFGGWGTLKKILPFLVAIYREGSRNFDGFPELSEEEKRWATEWMPDLAQNLSGEDLVEVIADVAQVYRPEVIGQILYDLPAWVKTKILVAILSILPKWAVVEFLKIIHPDICTATP